MTTAERFEELRNPALREHFVYRAFDSAGLLLYVGCSRDMPRRMREHKGWSTWYEHMSRLRLSGPYNFDTARRLEWQAIHSENPLHNAQSPENLAVRRARNAMFNDVVRTAIRHGEAPPDAMRQASIACDSEFARTG